MSINKTVLIWDSPEPIPDGDEFMVFWQSDTVVNLGKEISIPQVVEENADELRSQYLSFIYDLGEIKINNERVIDNLEIRSGFSFWWMTLLVEKCNYSKSPQIYNIIRFMAFEKWFNGNDFSTVKIATTNQELAKSIEIFTDQLGLLFEWVKLSPSKSSQNMFRRIYRSLPDIFKAPIALLYYLADRWKLKGVGIEEWEQSTATTTFVSYFFNLDTDAANRGLFKDRYWTKLPDLLDENSINSNWLHLYVNSDFLPTTESAKKLVEKLNKSHGSAQNHLFLDSFLCLHVVRRTIVDWVIVLSKYGKIKSGIKQQANHLWPLIKSDLKVSLVGAIAIQNLLFYHLFRSAIQILPTQKRGFYLQENQGWEFIGAWREFSYGQLIGVPHSTVRYWDLRYFFDSRLYKKNSYLDIPLPDKVAINGEVAKDAYINGGYAADQLVEVEALRYLQWAKIDLSNECALGLEVENINNVLVLGDYLQVNTHKQMMLLQEAYRLINPQVSFIVKPHPMCPISSDDYEEIDMLVTDHPIDKLIDSCVMAYTSSVTSAAVDVYCAGKKVITVLDNDNLNLSPLRGCKGVSFVSTSDELADIINGVCRIEIEKDQGKGYFYLSENLTRWKKLLIENNNVNSKVGLNASE